MRWRDRSSVLPFAVLFYLALKSNVIDLYNNDKRTVYFYSVVGFLAGFSERWARVIINRALRGDTAAEEAKKPSEDVVQDGRRRSEQPQASREPEEQRAPQIEQPAM